MPFWSWAQETPVSGAGSGPRPSPPREARSPEVFPGKSYPRVVPFQSGQLSFSNTQLMPCGLGSASTLGRESQRQAGATAAGCRVSRSPKASDPCADRPPTPSVAQEGFRCRQSANPTAREDPLPATVPGLPGAGGRCSYPFSSSTCFHAKRSVPGQNDPLATGEGRRVEWGEERPHLKAPPPPPESV